jgi:hypothetical protein
MSATRRIDRGRGHSYLLDGYPADGVTSILSNGIPKPALINWAARATAGYAVDHWDDLAGLGVAERLRTLERARWADSDGAAVRGTQIHQLAIRHILGEEIEIPEPLTGHVEAYERFRDEWQPVEKFGEVVVGNRKHRYMGTLDLVARLNDGQDWLLDWKTGSGIYPEAALQLAAYRYAEFYLDGKGEEQPMPEVDACGCIWLRADGYDLIPVQADPDVFHVFLYAQQVARFTQQPRDALIGEAL